MNITKIVYTNIYLIMTLFICATSYIYVVNGLKCHVVWEYIPLALKALSLILSM